MFRSKSFRSKTYLSFGIIIFLSVTLLVTVLQLFSILDGYTSYVDRVDALKNHVHQVKENENKMFLFDTKNLHFMESDSSEYVQAIEHYQFEMTEEIINLLEHPLTTDYNLENEFTVLNENFQVYTSLIEEVKMKIKEHGFGEIGVSGDLDKSINQLMVKSLMSEYEVSVSQISKLIFDFQLKETEEASLKVIDLLQGVIEAEQAEGDSLGLVSSFNDLLSTFKRFSVLSSEIGFTGKTGKRFLLIKNSESILANCSDLEETVRENVESKKTVLYIGFTSLALIQVVVCVLFAFSLSSSLLRRLSAISANLKSLSSGVFPDRIDVKLKDELGGISSSINELTDRIEYAADYARHIGQGNLSEEYNDEYSQDAIAKAIMEMQHKLKENADKDYIRVWRTEGLAKFSNILQENKDDLNELCFEIISNLVKYLKGNQGAFYVVNKHEDDTEVLNVSGAYAYERDKFFELEVEKGEGLIGEVWKEGETVVLSEIPDDYFSITSGLGEAMPTNIIILPLVYNEEIFGVIEIATFKEFTQDQIEFLEEVGGIIAGTISGTKVSMQTNLLLENSKVLQDEMKEQEEAMMQNLEEMKATQDTFELRESELMKEIEKLKKQ